MLFLKVSSLTYCNDVFISDFVLMVFLPTEYMGLCLTGLLIEVPMVQAREEIIIKFFFSSTKKNLRNILLTIFSMKTFFFFMKIKHKDGELAKKLNFRYFRLFPSLPKAGIS